MKTFPSHNVTRNIDREAESFYSSLREEGLKTGGGNTAHFYQLFFNQLFFNQLFGCDSQLTRKTDSQTLKHFWKSIFQ